MMEAGLSLGTNLGDRLAALVEAKRLLVSRLGLTILAQSPVYETEPVGVPPEYRHLRFLNAILIVSCATISHECMDHLHEIEDLMGRKRQLDRNAPRPIDIDLIYLNGQTIQSGGLVVPHPRWAERRFVVQPLADVRPDLILPGQTKTVREILRDLKAPEQVELFSGSW